MCWDCLGFGFSSGCCLFTITYLVICLLFRFDFGLVYAGFVVDWLVYCDSLCWLIGYCLAYAYLGFPEFWFAFVDVVLFCLLVVVFCLRLFDFVLVTYLFTLTLDWLVCVLIASYLLWYFCFICCYCIGYFDCCDFVLFYLFVAVCVFAGI